MLPEFGATLAALKAEHGALYYAKLDGSHLHRAVDHAVSFNGVGLSPDEATLYCSDTETQKLWAFEVEAPGKLVPRGASGRRGRVVSVSAARICAMPTSRYRKLAG